jgi:hypothetical protein
MRKHRTNLILLAVLLAFAAVYYFFVAGKTSSSLNTQEIDFAVRDTANIHRIRLVMERDGRPKETVDLRRTADGWQLNDNNDVNPAQIEALLSTIARVQYKSTLLPAGRATVMNMLREQRVRVEIETRNNGTKIYYVGSPTPNQNGTYFLMKGSENPYVVELPGHKGYLTPYFSPDPNAWRAMVLFDIDKSRLRSISLRYPGPDSSFTLVRSSEDKFALTTGEPVDNFMAERYLDELRKTYALGSAETYRPGLTDSLRTRPADISLELVDLAGQRQLVQFYLMPDNEDNLLALSPHANEALLVQYFVLKNFLARRNFFIKRQPQNAS